jgi:hypothetical protein
VVDEEMPVFGGSLTYDTILSVVFEW